jgi:hypothetical protein
MKDDARHAPAHTRHVPAQTKAARDVRLDVFRGLSMLIIFVAHVPDNPWASFIPARFGWSSAAEIFVFSSGLASSFAFGRTFVRHGFRIGLLRIVQRLYQVYWAHIGLCLLIMGITAYAGGLLAQDYFSEWGFGPLAKNAGMGIDALLTLQLLPALLNILPMYLVLLAMIPLAILMSRLHRWLPLAVGILLWLVVQFTNLNLMSPTDGGTPWFFNPLAWQLLFFTGFSIGMGWVTPPALRRGPWFWLALAFVVISIPMTFWAITDRVPALQRLQDALMPDTRPTQLHILRYIHFLCLAHVVLTLIDGTKEKLAGGFARHLVIIGQQTLPSFQAGLVLACILGIALDVWGRAPPLVAIANIVGFLGIYLVARITAYFKSPPWRSGKGAGASASE